MIKNNTVEGWNSDVLYFDFAAQKELNSEQTQALELFFKLN
jgi:hypothetical protein